MISADTHTLEALRQAVAGDREALGRLLEESRGRLRRMVEVRLDRRVHGRVAVSDVIQSTFIEAAHGLRDYVQAPSPPFFLWLRSLAGRQIHEHERRHLGDDARGAPEAGLESLPADPASLADLHALRAALLPGIVAGGDRSYLEAALQALDPSDREVLVLRHGEQLGTTESAAVLGLETAAAKNLYSRVMERLRTILTLPGGRTVEATG